MAGRYAAFSFLALLSFAFGEQRELYLILVTSSSPAYNTSILAVNAVAAALTFIDEAADNGSGMMGDFLREDRLIRNPTIIDTKCDQNLTYELLRQELMQHSREKLVAVIGCGCSNTTKALTNLIQQEYASNLPVILCSSHQSLSFREYPTIFRTNPTFQGVQNLITKLLQQFGWKQVFLFTEEINFKYQELNASLHSKDIKLLRKDHTGTIDFESLSQRIFIIDAYETTVRRIFCKAFKNNKYYPGVAWILLDNFINTYWYTVPDSECSPMDIRRALAFSIVIETNPGNDKEDIYSYAYDAVIGLALAFNRSSDEDRDIQNALINEMSSTSFDGLSGREISWVNHSIEENTLLLLQLRDTDDRDTLSENITGYYHHGDLFFNQSHHLWPMGFPSDGVPVQVIEPIKLWGFIFGIVLCISGLSWAFVCFVFVWIHRKTKVIKLTSPKLNYVILLGSSSVFLSNVAYTFPSANVDVLTYVCPTQPFLATVFGYNLCATVATIKLWRIYYIFKNPYIARKKVLRDWQLLIIIGVHTLVYFLIVGTMIAVDAALYPPILVTTDKESAYNMETGLIEEYYFFDCRTDSIFARMYYALTVGHVMIVHAIGLYFAFRIRKIKIVVLNEYKHVLGFILSSIGIVVMIMIALYFTGNDPTLNSFFISLLTSTVCLLFLGLTFIPKMVALKKDPNGDQLFKLTVNNAQGIPTNNVSNPDINSAAPRRNRSL